MKKIIIAFLCVFALSANGAAAMQEHSHKKKHHQTTTSMSRSSIPGNPYAGGGPTGFNQSTNSPNASNEIGSGR